VLGCKRRPVSASIMSRSCFASFPVSVYKFSSHYQNNIYRQSFGASSERLSLGYLHCFGLDPVTTALNPASFHLKIMIIILQTMVYAALIPTFNILWAVSSMS